MASALPSTFRRAWSEFSLRFRVMTELSPSTLNFLTMFATVPMLIPCDLAQSACFKTGGWASSKSSNILHLLARVSFVDLLRSILLSNETSSSDRLTEYDFGLAIVASPLVVNDGRKYITGFYKCQCVESLVAPPRWRLPMRVRFGTGCGTRTRGVVSVIKSDVQSPLCQASVEMVPPTRAARV